MRVFNVNSRNVNGTLVFDSCNLNLSRIDVVTICDSLKKFKSDDVFQVASKEEILRCLESYL